MTLDPVTLDRDGSYYYSNPDGSTYYKDGDGRSTYKAPNGDTHSK